MSYRDPFPSSAWATTPTTTTAPYQPTTLPNFDLRNQDMPWLHPTVRRWETAKLSLRLVLGLTSFGVCGAALSYEARLTGDATATAIVWPVALPGMAGALWDLADSLVRFARNGRSMPPRTQIGCELATIVGTLVAAGTFIWQIVLGARKAPSVPAVWPTSYDLVHIPIIAIFGFVLLSGRALLLARAYADRALDSKSTRPQAVYIPSTGTTAYVVLRYASDVDEIELESLEKDAYDADAAARTSSDTASRPATAVEDMRARLEAIRARRRVSRPPDDYVPDELELERRRRGEAQPQVIMPGDVSLKFAVPGTNMALEAPYSVENKMLVPPMAQFAANVDGPRSSASSTGSLRRIRSWG